MEDSEDLMKRLRLEGGFGLTHSGRLRRKDKRPFNRKSLMEALAGGCSQFLSFVAGAFTGVVLPRGFDCDGEEVWGRWDVPVIEPLRRARTSCFPQSVIDQGRVRPPNLGAVHERFIDGWNNPSLRELLRFGVGWYLTANPHHNAETRIILAQSGLELGAWTRFVGEDRMSKRGSARLPAAERIRLLIGRCECAGCGVPRGLSALGAYAKTRKPEKQPWADGPDALTGIRNLLVHSTRALRAVDIPSDVMMEAAELAMWYLQLALMFLLSYRDQYLSRVEGWAQFRSRGCVATAAMRHPVDPTSLGSCRPSPGPRSEGANRRGLAEGAAPGLS